MEEVKNSFLGNVNALPEQNPDSPIDERLRLSVGTAETSEEERPGLLDAAVNAVKDAFNTGYNTLMGYPGEKTKTYNDFRASLFETKEYSELGSDAERDALLNQNLKKAILNSIGPMRHGQRVSTYMAGPVDNRVLFGLLKVLTLKKDAIQTIMANLAGIDKKLYEYVREGGKYADNENVKGLIEELIDLQANALFALLEREIEPGVKVTEIVQDKTFFNDLIADIREKIKNVNDLLKAKSPEERVGILGKEKEEMLGGGYRNNRDAMKYMKYKAKYLKLKSRLQ